MGVSIEVPTLGKEIQKRRIEAGYMRIEISEATERDPFNYDYILEIYSGPADTLKIINRMQEYERDIKVVNETPLSIVCIPQRYGESFSTKVLFVLSDEKEFLVSLGIKILIEKLQIESSIHLGSPSSNKLSIRCFKKHGHIINLTKKDKTQNYLH